jgi:four helix bundle protein
MATGLENLKIYKLAVRLEVFIYKVTEKFPLDERFRSVDQLKRSSSSVPNNISEAYGKFHYRSMVNHLYIARDEAEETKSGVIRAYKKGFITKNLSDFIEEKYTELLKGINAYIKFIHSKQNQVTD